MSLEPWTKSTEGRSAAEPPDEPAPAAGSRDKSGPSGSGGRFDFEHAYAYAAAFLLVATAAFLYLGRPEAAFVAAALGASAWFLNVRSGLKREHDLVKRGGRNWEPRGRVEDSEDEDWEDEDSEA